MLLGYVHGEVSKREATESFGIVPRKEITILQSSNNATIINKDRKVTQIYKQGDGGELKYIQMDL